MRRLLLVPAFLLATALPALAQSPVTVSPDGQFVIVQKDVTDQRWALVQDRETRNATGNVFFANGGPAQFVFCRWLGGISYDCQGNSGCAQEPCAWNPIATVQLPDSFFQVPGGPQPTPQPQDPLAELIGTWDFTFATTLRYFLERVVTTDDGTRGLVGTDRDGDTLVVAELDDPDYDFGMVDPAGEGCLFHLFSKTGPDSIAGISLLTDAVGGECTTSPLGPPMDLAGVRVSRGNALSVARSDTQHDLGGLLSRVVEARRAVGPEREATP